MIELELITMSIACFPLVNGYLSYMTAVVMVTAWSPGNSCMFTWGAVTRTCYAHIRGVIYAYKVVKTLLIMLSAVI